MDDPIDALIPRETVEKTRAELAATPQEDDLRWPPPPGWDFHAVLVKIQRELAAARAAAENGRGDMIARLTAQADLKRAERRYARWKKITYYSGWRPWHLREPPERA